MIVPMKKISLISLAADKDATLERLRELGILHLQHIKPPAGNEVEEIKKHIERTSAALDILAAIASEKNKITPSAEIQKSADEMPVEEIVDRIHHLVTLRKEFSDRIVALREEKGVIEPYGDFDPALIDQLAQKGIYVKLYQTAEKHLPEPSEDVHIFPLSHNTGGTYFATVSKHDFSCDACEFIPHHRSLSMVEADIKEAETDISHVNQELVAFLASRDRLTAYMEDEEKHLAMMEAKNGAGDAGKLIYLQGFCPKPQEDELREAAKKYGWGLVIEEPSEDDAVPTVIKYPKWAKPISSLFAMIDVLPGYKEVDISSVFLLAFSLFFAILVGDAGYGTVFLLLTLYIRRKKKEAPAAPFNLMYILSISTIVWGVITGNYFGISFGALPAPLGKLAFSYEWLSNSDNFMALCFLIGAIHLSVAHAWRMILAINSTRAIAQFGWIVITWCMYFGAKNLVLGYPLPGFFTPAIITGIILVTIFMTPFKRLKTEWNGHITLPFDVIGNFVDLVSYVRLFAVGSASLAVAVAFNNMAIGNGINSVVAGLGAAIILFLGHALNIVLCIMGVLVHGIRLNTLEFSGHMGLEWSGFKYNPFKK